MPGIDTPMPLHMLRKKASGSFMFVWSLDMFLSMRIALCILNHFRGTNDKLIPGDKQGAAC
jgi:hypothetical protein